MVVNEALVCLFRSKVFQWVRPEQIAHEPMRWRFSKAIDLKGGSGSEGSIY